MAIETPLPDLSDNVTLFKSIYSVGLLLFSIAMIMGLIFTGQTKIAQDVSPILAFVVIWFAIIWLTVVEGGQASLVGLAPVNPELYKVSHKKAHSICKICFTGDNFHRYLLGRQFLVVLTVFAVNMSGGPIDGATLWGLPDWIVNIFLGSGLAMILFTVMCGQLNSEVNASLCMLDYMNNWMMSVTFWVSMAIEFTGLLHASYVCQMFVCRLAKQPVEWHEPPRTGLVAIFFWLRCVFSFVVLGFALAVTFTALFEGKTTVWDGIPPAAAMVIFLFLLCVVGMLEAIQIAFFAVTKICKADRGTNIFAKKTCHYLFLGTGENLPKRDEYFWVADGVQKFFDTGLLGALITTIIGSIAWRLVASCFPIAFISSPITYVFLRICLLLEASGLCQGAWVIADIHKAIAGFKRDEEYIGTAEERAGLSMKDNDTVLDRGPGKIVMLPHFIDHAPESLKELLESDPSVAKFVSSLTVANGNGRDDRGFGTESSDEPTGEGKEVLA
ncbi:Silicon transporter [Fragilaria crotonensis]|nr:Silicon transporter [Fragilaria crotonensis]